MHDDPGAKRTIPAPPHPRGLQAADDAPVYLAPPIDVRPWASHELVPDSIVGLPEPPPSSLTDPTSNSRQAISANLDVPAEERTPPSVMVMAQGFTTIELGEEDLANIDDEDLPTESRPFDRQFPPSKVSTAVIEVGPLQHELRHQLLTDLPPVTVSFERAAVPRETDVRPVENRLVHTQQSVIPLVRVEAREAEPADDAPHTLDFERPRRQTPYAPQALAKDSEEEVRASEVEAFFFRADSPSFVPQVTLPALVDEVRMQMIRELRELGSFEVEADRQTERPIQRRVTLARARSLRFKLALHDMGETIRALMENPVSSPAPTSDGWPFELPLEGALLVVLSDGAPDYPSPTNFEADMPCVRVLLESLLVDFPYATPHCLREKATASLARMTMAGWATALDRFRRLASTLSDGERKKIFEIACRVALVPQINPHRLGALNDLERALQQPSNSVALMLEYCRRMRFQRANAGQQIA